MDIRIKQSTDIDLLIEWRIRVLRDVFSIPKEKPIDSLKRANLDYYKSFLENGSHIACFAYFDNEIVGCGGMCLYNEMPSPDNQSGKCAYLMNIYTCPQFRKNGIAEKIVNWLIDKAEDKGITKIYLETSEAGRKMYYSVGFREMKDQMQLDMDLYGKA